MQMESRKTETFSEDVKDILSKMPNWLIQWGTTVIFIVLSIVLLFSYLIEYPEIIEGDVVVTSLEPPVKLSANQSKPIKKIYVENQETVREGEVLLEFRSPSSLEEILYLEHTISEIEEDIQQGILKVDYEISNITIGEKQSQLSELNDAITAYNRHITFGQLQQKLKLINKRIAFKNDYGVLLKNLLRSVQERTDSERENYSMQKELYKENVISKAQFLTDKIAYLTKEEQVDEFKKAIIQNEMSIHEDVIEKENQRNSDQLRALELQSDILRIINGLKSFSEEWFQAYTIRSPQSGELNYLKNFYTNEYVFAGDPLFAINTNSSKSVAYCYLPIEGYGKVQMNQKARIKLNNYPYEEFGYLEGKVKTVSHFSNEDMYLTVIELSNGTLTNTNRKLNLVSETKGRAEIVTKDLRLIDRLFFNLKKLSTEI